MRNAARGCGLIVTGGYDSEHVDVVIAAHDRDEHGGRVTPSGADPDPEAYVAKTRDFGDIEQDAYNEIILLEEQLRADAAAKSVTKLTPLKAPKRQNPNRNGPIRKAAA